MISAFKHKTRSAHVTENPWSVTKKEEKGERRRRRIYFTEVAFHYTFPIKLCQSECQLKLWLCNVQRQRVKSTVEILSYHLPNRRDVLQLLPVRVYCPEDITQWKYLHFLSGHGDSGCSGSYVISGQRMAQGDSKLGRPNNGMCT